MKSKLKRYFPYIAPFLSFVGLVMLLNATNPLDIGPAGILLIFGLAYAFAASSLYLLLTLLLIVLANFMVVQVRSKRRIYYMASIVALSPIFLVALNSIGQLQIRDFIFVIVLIGLACFYVSKRA